MIFLYAGLISWYRAVVTTKMNCLDLSPWKDDCLKTPALSLCVYCHLCIQAVSHGYSQPGNGHGGLLSRAWHGTPQPADVGPRTPHQPGWSHLRPGLKSETFLTSQGSGMSMWRILPSLEGIALNQFLTGLTLTGCLLLEGTPQVALVVKNLPADAGDLRDVGLIPGSGRFSWRRAWQPTLVFLPGESPGTRSWAGYGP